MGSTVSVMGSVQPPKINVPMATEESSVNPWMPAEPSKTMTSSSSSSLPSEKMSKGVSEDEELTFRHVLEEENPDRSNETKEQVLTSAELEEALKELNLSTPEKESAFKLFNGHPRLVKYLKEAIDCVLSFKRQSVGTASRSLADLERVFFDLNATERNVIGEFLSHVKFCEESYVEYMRLLKESGLEHFSDSIFESEDSAGYENRIMFWYIRSQWWNFSDSCAMFGARLVKQGAIIQELIHNIVSLIGNDGKKLKRSITFESAIGTLHNLARLTNSRQMFREMKLVDILANFLNYEDQPKVTLVVLLVLALIIDENQTHLLTSHDSVFDLIICLTKEAWALPNHRRDGFSVEELIHGMKGLSRNDTVKKVLVQKGILPLVLQVLTGGDENEKKMSIKLLWELSFDPENKIKIQQDKALMQAALELSKHSNRKIAKAAQGVLWVIGMKKDKTGSAKTKKTENLKKSKENGEHIMISYNWNDQTKLRKICEVLRSQGYKVWMDVDNIQGSTLQAMAEAVEQAALILICISEKYKESSNCRSEAEYAFNLRKPIVPLIMQSAYKPDGWLGIMLGTKLFFDFSGKYSFEQKVNELVKEIGTRGKRDDDITQDSPDGRIKKREEFPLGKVPDAHPLAQFNMLDWIKENDLEKFESFQSLTAGHLRFLKRLSNMAPEFYYSFMLDFISGKRTADDLTGLMMVTSAVEKLPR